MQEQYAPGQTFTTSLKIDSSLLEGFAQLSGDFNPIHLDAEVAKAHGFPRPVAHGAILSALLSRLIGNQAPGPGALWKNQSMDWVTPVYLGDQIELSAMIDTVSTGAGVIRFTVEAVNQSGVTVMTGNAEVLMTRNLTGASHQAVVAVQEPKPDGPDGTNGAIKSPNRTPLPSRAIGGAPGTNRVALVTVGRLPLCETCVMGHY